MSDTTGLAARTRDQLAALADAQDAIVSRTEAWSRINSGSREIAGLSRMADTLCDAFSSLPGAIERKPLPPSVRITARGDAADDRHGDAIAIRVRAEAPIQVALTGHYDTVFPASHPFQSPTRRPDGALHGPGCADMKGGLSVMLAALQAFERLPEKDAVGYTVLLSPDEEIGSPASAPLLAELGRRSQVGMTYEPALPTGALVSARKGSGNFSLAIHGKAAHVGRAFQEGISAIGAAADATLRLLALNGARDGVTVNVGAIDGGGPTNIVPDRAVIRFNIRAPDDQGRAWAQDRVAEIVRACEAPGVTLHLHGGFSRPPKPMSPALDTLIAWHRAAGADLGLDLAFAPTGGVCEGNNLTAAGCPTIDTLGPCGGALHSDEEFALIDSFSERAQLSLLMLAGFASGRFDPRTLRPS